MAISSPVSPADRPLAVEASSAERSLSRWATPVRAKRIALITLAISLAGFVATIILVGAAATHGGLPIEQIWLAWRAPAFLAYPVVAWVILTRRPAHPIGWLLAVIAVMGTLDGLSSAYGAYGLEVDPGSLPGAVWVAWGSFWYPFVVWAFVGGLLAIFPTGRPLGGWWRLPFWLGGVGALGASLSFAFGAATVLDGQFGDVPNPTRIGGPVGDAMTLLGLGFLLILLSGLPAIASVLVRLRRAHGLERQQLKWVAWISVWVGAFYVVHVYSQFSGLIEDQPWIAVVWSWTYCLIPVAMALSILRYRLFDIDVIINRSLVYVTLSAMTVAVYSAIVGLSNLFLSSGQDLVPALLASALIAIGFLPAHAATQRTVNRLLYGQRDTPYAVLARLGNRLTTVGTFEQLGQTVCRTVQETLKLPFVAVTLSGTEAGATALSAISLGTPVAAPRSFRLNHDGRDLGELRVSPRSGSDQLSSAEELLLVEVARQTGIVAWSVGLTDDLRRARERLVTTREEERRTLRRDLHDRLGAQLAALLLQARLAERSVQADDEPIRADLAELREGLASAIKDVRRIAHGLRPPALDQLGLFGAIRQRLELLNGRAAPVHLTTDGTSGDARPPLRITLDAPDDVPALPAAVEVAAWHIVEEAMTNIIRHAEATEASVSITADSSLDLTIRDNGRGLPPNRAPGVGLHSMRERVDELFGTFSVVGEQGGETCLRASLPIGSENHAHREIRDD